MVQQEHESRKRGELTRRRSCRRLLPARPVNTTELKQRPRLRLTASNCIVYLHPLLETAETWVYILPHTCSPLPQLCRSSATKQFASQDQEHGGKDQSTMKSPAPPPRLLLYTRRFLCRSTEEGVNKSAHRRVFITKNRGSGRA